MLNFEQNVVPLSMKDFDFNFKQEEEVAACSVKSSVCYWDRQAREHHSLNTAVVHFD